MMDDREEIGILTVLKTMYVKSYEIINGIAKLDDKKSKAIRIQFIRNIILESESNKISMKDQRFEKLQREDIREFDNNSDQYF